MNQKRKVVATPRPAAAGKIPSSQRKPNPNLNAQTRKVLAKHYRAKYGVR